jgi:hypothetical protein
MTDRLEPHSTSQLAALERRLARSSLPTLPPDLRQRVLAAVDAVLDDTASATVPDLSGESFASSRNGLAFVVSAVAAAIVLMVFSTAITPISAVPLSLDDRARIAGMSELIDAMPRAGEHSGDVAFHPTPTTASARPAMLRPLDTPRILQETL